MRRRILGVLMAICGTLSMSAAFADEFSGEWVGPWYRGMTSGTMVLLVDAKNEKAKAQFTNLDGFGESVVPVYKFKAQENQLRFNAAGEGPGVFVAIASLTSDSKVLEGKGEYDGFAIKFTLKRR